MFVSVEKMEPLVREASITTVITQISLADLIPVKVMICVPARFDEFSERSWIIGQ